MTILVYADVHYSPQDAGNKLGSKASSCLREVFTRHGCKKGVLSVEIGDLITAHRQGTAEERRAEDLRRMRTAMLLSRASHISFHLHGNHEDENLLRGDVEQIASEQGVHVGNALIRHKNLTVIMWSPDCSIRKENNGSLTVEKEEIDRLKSMLDKASSRVVVMTHLPLDGDITDFSRSSVDQRINPVFGKGVSIPYATHYPNSPEIRDVIKSSNKVIACFAGHTHWNEAHTIDGVSYITIPSLVEKFDAADGKAKPWLGHALVDYNHASDVLDVGVHGETPVQYRVNGRAGTLDINPA